MQGRKLFATAALFIKFCVGIRMQLNPKFKTIGMTACPLTTDEITRLVHKRDAHRNVMEYKESDDIKQLLENYNIVISDASYKSGSNSTWMFKDRVIEPVATDLMDIAHSCYDSLVLRGVSEVEICRNVKASLMLQRYAEGAASGSTDTIHHPPGVVPVVQMSTEMQGRKYADVAFEFSLAGIADEELFEMLANSCAAELRRFGHRKSCGPLQIIQIVEKLLVAGVRDHPVFQVAVEVLQTKSTKASIVPDLFRGRALLWLWRHATKQTKPTKVAKVDTSSDPPEDLAAPAAPDDDVTLPQETRLLEGLAPIPSPDQLFADPSLPLLLDLGCGYGVSLLSLCAQNIAGRFPQRYNFLGVDLNNRAMRYASGISRRWKQAGQAAFVYADCVESLQWVLGKYPGPVALVMVNFPTPYSIEAVTNPPRIKEGETADESCAPPGMTVQAGNSQLPSGFDNFMFNPHMASLVRKVLARSTWARPLLLLQSNVEDVTVTMRNIVHAGEERDCGGAGTGSVGGKLVTPSASTLELALGDLFGAATVERPAARWRSLEELTAATDPQQGGGRMPQRLQTWLETLEAEGPGSTVRNDRQALDVRGRMRAYGEGWLSNNPFPGSARTETEVHCEVERQPVHRTMFMFER